MKPSVKLLYTIASIVLGSAMSTSYAGDELVRELGSVDLGVLAQEAAADQKQLMLVYYDNDCKACDELNQLYNAAGAKGSQLERDFVIHKTNVSTGFNITCPNGQEFADNEFMAMKGITKLPALVITDSEGNVTFVENNVTSKNKLIAVSKKFKKRNMAQR